MTSVPDWTARARRDLTLDLFTQSGAFWDAVRELRDGWRVVATRALPPSPPPGSLVAAGYVSVLQMPERFHVPPEPDDTVLAGIIDLHRRRPELPPLTEEQIAEDRALHTRLHLGQWGFALRDLASDLDDRGVVDISAGGTDDLAWQRWLPFLSACALYDPPETDLLAFAEHNHRPLDGPGTEVTFRRKTEVVLRAAAWRDARLRAIGALPELERDVPALLAFAGYFARAAAAWRPSTAHPSLPRAGGRPALDPLLAVQGAILFDRLGLTYNQIADRLSLTSTTHESYDRRRRSNSAINHVRQGRAILASRKNPAE